MSHRLLPTAALALLLAACATDGGQREREKDTPRDAGPPSMNVSQVHDEAITIDSHVDIPPSYATEEYDPAADGPLQVDLPKMREGGLDAVFFIVYVGQGPLGEDGYEQAYAAAIEKFDAIHRQSALYGDQIAIALGPEDVRAHVAAGRLAAMIGVENGYPVGEDLYTIDEFYQRGARYMSLTHAGDNQFATSSTPRGQLLDEKTAESGLSDLGRSAVQRMNDLGMMIDVSHASKASTLEIVGLSRAPVIASHSGVRALNDVPRNLSDEELQAIAEKGGVVQIVAFDTYLKTPSPEKVKVISEVRREFFENPDRTEEPTYADYLAFQAEVLERTADYPRAGVNDLVDHIDYAVALIGIDHVGISSDFGGGGGIAGWETAAETENVTKELVRRGYSQDQINKIWGGNLLRVWAEVEAAAD
ncbi:MAG: dipeptidase [Alphaproteobacteria bacterium]|nr:dipeptidase [Alphaproteobacteria bacterium]